MQYKLKAIGKKIVQYDDWEEVDYAVCDTPEKAIELLNKAWDLNESRKYTASARMFAQVEMLPGFKYFNL